MKMSRRAKRMALHHRRHKGTGALNMVSLMDIFTILVFFLLVNANEVELITPPKSVSLPESTAQARPQQTVTVTVSPDAILVNERKILGISRQLLAGEGPLNSLVKALAALENAQDTEHATLTVLADRSIEYALIKRILQSATAAGFADIALAVLQAPEALP